MVYLPAGKFFTSYEPAPSEVAETTRPLEFFTVMLAPGMTAPVWSVICPWRRPAGACANNAPEQTKRMQSKVVKTRTRVPNGQNFINSLLKQIIFNKYCRFHCGPASPPGAPMFQPEKSAAALEPFGDAVRIGSTPPSNVMAVTSPLPFPSEATTITASSFCKSARVELGIRLRIC